MNLDWICRLAEAAEDKARRTPAKPPCYSASRTLAEPIGIRMIPLFCRTNYDSDKTKIGYGFIFMVCIKFSFPFNKTTARAATTSLINQWLAMAAEWRKD